jgi:ATP-dependent DNA helicase RecG
MSDVTYTTDISALYCVGPKRAALFNKEISVFTVHDLLYYYPYRYVDRSQMTQIRNIDLSMPYVQLKGQILGFDTVGEGKRERFIAHFSDGTGVVDLVWFQGIKYVVSKYKVNKIYIVFGKPAVYNGRINLSHPEVEEFNPDNNHFVGLRPFYNTSEKMKKSFLNTRSIEKVMAVAVDLYARQIEETLPDYLIQRNHLMPLGEAIHYIHFPPNDAMLRRAQYRLKFEELFYVQLDILRYVHDRRQKYKGYIFAKVGANFNNFYFNYLPFELTGAQKRVMKEIRSDMGSGRQMNRLLQGDVGSGKTMVALMSMFIATDNNYQACLMAPTEILAHQHFETISAILNKMGIRSALLTGSVKGKRREAIYDGLKSGDISIIIGTHALLEDTVTFHSLGLVVIDEQHRFGVAQRARMWNKSAQPPHILVMTATPIPRTLAMTVYGDLDVSVIDELPPGRKPITTIHQYDNRVLELHQFMAREIEQGHQIYIVYPLIQESEKMDLKNLEEGFEQIKSVFPVCNVCKVHGKMKSSEKDEQMQLFVSGKAQIMVATTVIEVGVNVPNASVMIIENAERFGLSQLHQLRGRVGRGSDQSYCILVTSYQLASDTKQRIKIMCESNDGFKIAEADLKLRGPGDLEGTQQSGMPFELKIANIATDGQLIQVVRAEAQAIVEEDEKHNLPQNQVLWRQLEQLHSENINWSSVS